MTKNTFTPIIISADDGTNLQGYLFDQVSNPIGILQIIHGMQEHAARYFETAEFFNQHGYIVFVSDLRGHGKSAESVDKQGVSEDIFPETVADQVKISQMLVARYPELPLYVFGHSYGSLITQRYIQVCDLPAKTIICGTTNGDNMLMKFGRVVAWFTRLKNGKHGKATLIEKLSFDNYSDGFSNGNWLTRDEEVFKKYQVDEYCGHPFPVSFYRSLFREVGKLNKNIKYIPTDLKIMLIYGDQDPLGGKGKLIQKLFNKYRKANLDVTIKGYEGARHELLNEINKDEVRQDILDFLAK